MREKKTERIKEHGHDGKILNKFIHVMDYLSQLISI